MFQYGDTEHGLQAFMHIAGKRRTCRRDEAQRMQGAQPFLKIDVRGIGGKRDAAAGEQRGQHRRRERMGIIYG